MKYTLTDIFKWFKKNNPNTEITEKLFRNIWAEYIEECIDKIVLEGKYIVLYGSMGELLIVEKTRNPNKLAPDWGTTNKLRKEGFEGVVYFTDLKYHRFLWRKSKCYVKNKTIWNFKPTRGVKGLKTKLIEKLNSNEFNQLKFKNHANI
jgi:hypothetical protein